ncbi:unnamed protein product [Parnassius apollo]|uniref:(apollo) hypothetical protein n=1 Tax=Parnassius apollo TaxID=110799 RepID=A0A8S3WSI6_PARAO|nr:unnamed protein product [Parnassius apollo]
MEAQSNINVNRAERGDRIEDLHLDSVVASQPEIGPTPPDGGYGWLIVFSAAMYHITVPAVLSLYGLIILKAIREEDHDEGEVLKLWDMDIALVPVIMVIIRLLLESWCRAMVKIFNMPRFIALSGLSLTVAGVLLSSYSTNAYSNDHIVNIFSGIFAGIGCALTGQQTDVIITHYFREKLTMAQRIVRMAPSVGNSVVPILVGYLCTMYTGDVVVMIYGAIMMQNCLFLAAYTRPLYIEKVIRTTYNMLRDAAEDEDEVIFSNQRQTETQNQVQTNLTETTADPPQDDDNTDVVVFKSRKDAKEIIDPSVELRENRSSQEARFSSDFSTMFTDVSANRFSTDFGALDVNSFSRISGYRELTSIEQEVPNPQPLYRETTINAPQNGLIFSAEVTPGTARRTASLKKNFITVVNMLQDLNFYLYTLLHLCTTFSILVLGVVFPPLIWEQNPSMNIWSVSTLIAAAHGAALCFIMLCVVLPKSINQKARLCAACCACGTLGFYGITLTENKSFLVVWCMLASFSTAASNILEQPLYNSTLNEFDTTATMTTANVVVAVSIMIWSLAYNYEYRTCFFIASLLQVSTACAFLASSFRRRRQ